MEPTTKTTQEKPAEPGNKTDPGKSRIRQLASQLSMGREQMNKKRKLKRWIYWILFLALGVAGYWIWQMYQPIPVTTSVVSYQRIGAAAQPIMRVSGTVTYPRIAAISAQTQAPVTRLTFDLGDRVQAGQILAEFDQSELQARRELQQITLRDLEESRQRVQNLYEGGAASEAELQNIQTQLASARANLDLLNTQIENSVVRAPFSGIIIAKMVELGEVANLGICRLADDNSLLIAVDVNQDDIAKISTETSAVVSLDAYPETEYAADIYEIMPIADPAKNTIQVKVRLLQPDDRFRPNMSARVFFTNTPVTENATVKSVLTVDKAAITEQDGQQKLLLVEGGRVRERTVELGTQIGDRQVEIVSGAVADQRAILNPGQYELNIGDRVQIQ